MERIVKKDRFLVGEIRDFFIHLRWHYQVCILSGGFLMGGYLSADVDWPSFLLQFGNVHLLLFGGATAYNSYWDKDSGPVGGLKHPPPMRPWMWAASLLAQLLGLVIALTAGWTFALIYLGSILFFWLYSTPYFRWKGRPLLSLVAIGISTGTNSLLMGYVAAGNEMINISIWMAALGVALIMLSLYPPSQLFQLDEDYKRGDETFALTFGFAGVIQFFQVAFSGGLLMVACSIALKQWLAGVLFLIVGAIAGFWVYRQLLTLTVEVEDYPRVMHIKYSTSLAFVSFILLLFIFKHLI